MDEVYNPHRFEIKKNGKWEEEHFSKVKTGDNFKMYHQDGNQFLYEQNGEDIYQAASEPYYDEELGVWLITIK